MSQWKNPNDTELRELLRSAKTIAVVGCSPKPERIVNVFLRPELTPGIAVAAVAIKAEALWLQQGIINEVTGQIATTGGLDCVMDRCIAVMHRMLLR